MQDFIPGQRWVSDADLQLGLGTVTAVDQRTVTINYNAVGEKRTYSRQSAPLTRVIFSKGDVVPSHDGWDLIIEAVMEEEGLLVYVGRDEQGMEAVLVETDLADLIVINRPVERLFSGQVDPNKWFILRHEAVKAFNHHLSMEIYGLVGVRTSLIPHQLYIAHEVAQRYAPRVLLADEVGLGKTIEAGLILHQQLLTERARRVLVVVPESLVHQWLVEMLRRFNLLFKVFDEDRCQAAEQSNNGENPFQSEQLILCSLNFLDANPHRVKQLIKGEWDLLVVDEAHHLHWTPQESGSEYRIIEQLAINTTGVLLLTATPEQSGKAGHFARLRLLDPDRFSDYETFIREEESYGTVTSVVNTLLDEKPLSKGDIRKLQDILQDNQSRGLIDSIISSQKQGNNNKQCRRELISNLVDRHGTGRIMFRNTRAAVKGFPDRRVFAVKLPLPAGYSDCLADYKKERSIAGGLLLSPEVLYMSGRQAQDPHWSRIDPRIEWLAGLLKDIKPNKVLVISALIQTVLDLAEALKLRFGIHAAVFHEQMSLLERDRAAAYFADQEEGCQLLICSEIGSEGRNFQFAHHLVLFDLPIDPDLLEQRIGRLDRIGQNETVNIHVPYLENSAQSVMYHWYREGLNALDQTCPAGYPVFCKLQSQLVEALIKANVEHHDMPEFIQRTRDLQEETNRELQAGRDRLLEYNSCLPEIAEALKQQAAELDSGSGIEDFMDAAFDCFGVHIEEHSLSSYIISPGEKMIMPYPGLPDEGMTITYNRNTALTNEDMHFLSWEHPMVITAFDLISGSELGNSAVCSIEHQDISAGSLLLECLFVLEPVQSRGIHINRFFPPTLIRILLDENNGNQPLGIPHEEINKKSEFIPEDIARQVIKMKKNEIGKMIGISEDLAQQKLPDLVSSFREKSDRSFSNEIERLEALSMVNKNVRKEELEYFRKQQTVVAGIIESAVLRLDALRVIIGT